MLNEAHDDRPEHSTKKRRLDDRCGPEDSPVHGPDVTAATLTARWRQHADVTPAVTTFYGHGKSSQFRSFSNFYRPSRPMTFVVPACCTVFCSELTDRFKESGRVEVSVAFSETSIMLSKAAQ